jgi:hypothetical protein
MSKRASKLSDAQIRKAIAPRALPVYSEEDLETRERLVEIGAQSKLACRKGGRSNRRSSDLRRKRLIMIPDVYRNLSPSLKKTPTGARTIAHITDRLAKLGVQISTNTVRRDIVEIGTNNLRKL